jgi:Fe-S-cluster containining protein
MSEVATDGELQGLCVVCGLCCDGSLFERIEVRPADLVRLGSRNPTAAVASPLADGSVHATPDRLPLPCGFLGRSPESADVASACTVYADRPECCAKFRCALLESLSRGEREYRECVRLVDEARRRVRHLRQSLDLAHDAPLWSGTGKRLDDMGALDDASSRRGHAKALMDAAELRTFFSRVFGMISAARESR